MKCGSFFLLVLFAGVVVGCVRDDGGVQSAEKRELTLWQIFTPPEGTTNGSHADWQEFFEHVKGRFEAHTGATLNNVYIANEAYKTHIKAAVESREAPDVFHSWSGRRGMDFVEAGAVLDITQEVQSMIGTYFAKVYADSFLKTEDNRYYGVPFLYTSKFMFYNERLFKKYNMAVPRTFGDILKSCKVFRANGVIPLVIGNGESWQANHYMTVLNPRYVGVERVRADYALQSSEYELYADSGYVRALKKLQSLNEAGCFQRGVNATKPEVAAASFGMGEAAMFFGGTWRISVFDREYKDLKYTMSLFPLTSIKGSLEL